MQTLNHIYQPFRAINSRAMIGGGVLGLLTLGELAFAYASSLV